VPLRVNEVGSIEFIFKNDERLMKAKYRLWQRRGGVYYAFDRVTKKQTSLETRDKHEAIRLLNAKNEAEANPLLNRQIARAYLAAADPAITKRTWRYAFEELIKTKHGENAHRWGTAMKDEAFELIIDLPIIETRPDHFLAVLNAGTVSTNVFLRRVHNFALGLCWLHWPVLPPRQWPKVRHKEMRAVTQDEHERVIEREQNPERRAFYQLLWELGGAQGDIARLCAEYVDWESRVVSYIRQKTKKVSMVRLDENLENILRTLPSTGPLFPYLRTVRASDRATEFKQRCSGLGIKGITLHSYRYAWAERAKECGYPERFAQQALGHDSKAVHRAYARKAKVIIPALGEWKKNQARQNVVAVEFPKNTPAAVAGTSPAESTVAAG
jgi:integrase